MNNRDISTETTAAHIGTIRAVDTLQALIEDYKTEDTILDSNPDDLVAIIDKAESLHHCAAQAKTSAQELAVNYCVKNNLQSCLSFSRAKFLHLTARKNARR